VNILLIFLTSLGSVYLAVRLARYGAFSLADLSVGLFSGGVSCAATQFLGQPGAHVTSPALLLACGLAIELVSLRRRRFIR
jgi:hypothetical protein